MIRKISLLTIALCTLVSIRGAEHIVRGTVRSNEGKALQGVLVTDGRNFALTDKKGRYTLTSSDEERFVYLTTPSGYEPADRNSVPLFWLPQSPERKVYDFTLEKKKQDDTRHGFVAIADPQIYARKEFTLFEQAAESITRTVSRYDIPFHGVCCGDVTSFDHSFYPTYNEIAARTGLKFYSTIGNHDMTLYGRSFETSTREWEEVFGPTHYSFNVGKAHYVVLNNNFYIGRDYFYIGYLDERQLDWLEQDLKHVAPESLVFVIFHIPSTLSERDRAQFSYSTISNIMTNSRSLYKMLEPYNAHLITGHMHTSDNEQISDRLFEHNIPGLCGAWWQGVLCTDGTPRGYSVFEVDGNRVNWFYQPTDFPADYQMEVYYGEQYPQYKGRIVADVWAYDPTWRVEVCFDGGEPQPMERFTGYDPAAQKMYADPSKLDHPYVAPTPSDHFFRAAVPEGCRRAEVRCTDGFGRRYTRTLDL